MTIGVLLALQLRLRAGLRTLVLQADLQHGFDLAWRDAVRVQLRAAGLVGRWWLAADASLGAESVRVRIGPLVAPAVALLEFGVGQGRRAGVHLFGALIRGLIDCCAASAAPVPLGPPGSPAAQFSFLLLQFVDDSFALQASESGVAAVARGLSAFCARYRHAFQGGPTKGPAVMAVGGPPPDVAACGQVAGWDVRAAPSLSCLGVPIETALSLTPLLDRACARLRDGARKLIAGMTDRGFGMPVQAVQFPARVEASALYGTELLASCALGWPAVRARLNQVYYDLAKLLLTGASGTLSLGPGGHVRAFLEARFLTRLGTKVTRRVIMARARLALLPSPSPISPVLAALAAAGGEATWLEHAEAVAREVGVSAWPSAAPGATPDQRRRVGAAWGRAVVDPLLEALESDWFVEQVGRLAGDGLVSLGDILPLRQPWPRELLQARWGPAMWRYHRAWCTARVTLCIPGAVWGLYEDPVVVSAEPCPLCGGPTASLPHLVEECAELEAFRREAAPWYPAAPLTLAWALGPDGDMDVIADRVRLVGAATGAYVGARVRARTRA